jgi:hypothetical protein
MDGNSHRNNARRRQREIIERWMLSNIENRGFERYDELHIDRIDKKWKNRSTWLDGGLQALQLGVEVRDRYRLDFTVAIGYSLTAERTAPPPLRSRQELLGQLDWSPPSLYLFPKWREPWIENSARVRTLHQFQEVGTRGSKSSGSKSALSKQPQWYYLEFVQDNQHNRSVFAASRPTR